MLKINGPVKSPLSCLINTLCCCCLNSFSPAKDQDVTEITISKDDIEKTIVGYPNLGPIRTKQRNSFFIKCYKCGDSNWTKTYRKTS